MVTAFEFSEIQKFIRLAEQAYESNNKIYSNENIDVALSKTGLEKVSILHFHVHNPKLTEAQWSETRYAFLRHLVGSV